MKIKRIKKININCYEFKINWTMEHDGGDFDYCTKIINIGIKTNTTSEIFMIICHEMMELVAIEMNVRFKRPDCETDYMFVYDHRQHETMMNMFSYLVSQFIFNEKGVNTMNEEQVENAVIEKNLNAPRITPSFIDSIIVNEKYHVFSDSQLTVCCLTLRNGFTVTGESACASPENFDKEIGEGIAKKNARDKIWALEGYLLKQNLNDKII